MIHSSQTIASARLARDSLRTGEEEVEATTSLIAFCQHQVLWYDSAIPRELQTGPPHDVPFAYRYSGIKTQPKLGKQASEQQNKTNIGSLVLVEVAFAKVFFKTIIMSISATRFVVARAMTRSRASAQQQKRGIVDYLTNYPDKVNEIKKIHCKGGTQLGESNPTWLKQSSDKYVAAFVFSVAGMGLFRLVNGYYCLATGKGKLD